MADNNLPDWQKVLLASTEEDLNKPTPAPAPNVATQTAPVALPQTADTDDGETLGCQLCYRQFPPEELTVASKERLNWESAVVVCPECLTELRLEMREKSKGVDLLLGLIWAVIGFVVCTIVLGVAIWLSKSNPSNALFWAWMGSYFAVAVGFIIGRGVRYGVGKRHSLEQQLIAVFATFATIFATNYIGSAAINNNFADVLLQTTNHPPVIPSPLVFATAEFLPMYTNLSLSADTVLARLLIIGGALLGLVVAFFASAGLRIYTKPFVKK
jgi:hypothetical protein